MSVGVINRRSRFFFLTSVFVLLLSAFLAEYSDGFLVNVIVEYPYGRGLIFVFLGLQILFSPIQSGYSDFYCRRKGLIVAITATLVYLTVAHFSSGYGWVLIGAIVIRAVLGNVLPIAWAGLADLTRQHNFRFVLALSICALAVGSWSSLAIQEYTNNMPKYWPTLVPVIVCLVLLMMGFFQDSEDLHPPEKLRGKSFSALFRNEISSIIELCSGSISLLALTGFLFAEISFYQVIFRIDVLSSYSSCLFPVPFAIAVGYTVGTIGLKFVKLSDKAVCLIGAYCATAAILILWSALFMETSNGVLFGSLFTVFSFGAAFLTPAIFSFITPKAHPHIRGKIFGIVESFDSIAMVVTYAIVFWADAYTCAEVMLLSVVAMILALVFLSLALHSKPREDKMPYL